MRLIRARVWFRTAEARERALRRGRRAIRWMRRHADRRRSPRWWR